MVTRFNLWWARHQVRVWRAYEREDYLRSIKTSDTRRQMEKDLKALEGAAGPGPTGYGEIRA